MAEKPTADRSRRMRLRDITLAMHGRLDDGIGTAGLLDNPTAYLAYLQATLQARQPIERALDEAGAELLLTAWPRRRLADHLAADIEDLGGDVPTQGLGPPERLLPAEIVGVLYVLEGSALGAKLLFKRAQAIGMTATRGARHLHAQTADPSAWRAFLGVLESQPMTAEDEILCEGAALRTFAAFERSLLGPSGSHGGARQAAYGAQTE